jgi:beta-galactosidase/beta-glucuronidase
LAHFNDQSSQERDQESEKALRGMIARDFNHPAIFSWVTFNETWGIGDGGYKPDRQAWVAEMYRWSKGLDPTRLIEDNSPCNYDHVITDINSWHFYINDCARPATGSPRWWTRLIRAPSSITPRGTGRPALR